MWGSILHRWIWALLILLGPTLAQGEGGQGSEEVPKGGLSNFFNEIFDIQNWLTSVKNQLGQLEGAIVGLALALVMLGFVYGIIQGIMGGGFDALRGTFVRLAIVGLLLSLHTNSFIKNTFRDAMSNARNWSNSSAVQSLLDAGDELNALAQRIVPLMGVFGAIKYISAKTAMNTAKSGAKRTLASGIESGSGKIIQYLNWAALLLVPMVLFYFVIIVLANFTLEVGMILFPLAAAMLIFPRASAADWFGKWVATVSGAFIIVILLPIGFGTAVQMGIERPVHLVNDYVSEKLAEIRENIQETSAEIEKTIKECSVFDILCSIDKRLDQAGLWLKAAASAIGVAIQAWLLSVILMLTGMLAGAYILFNIEKIAVSFIGGFVAQGVRSMLGRASIGGRIYGDDRRPVGSAEVIPFPGPTPPAASASASGSGSSSPSASPSPTPVAYRMASSREASPGGPPSSPSPPSSPNPPGPRPMEPLGPRPMEPLGPRPVPSPQPAGPEVPFRTIPFRPSKGDDDEIRKAA